MAPGDKQAFLSVGKRGIGCSVRNGFPNISGLFVIAVTPGSISDKAGIRVGDEIVSVNGKDITKWSYSEAVYLLKSFQELQLILRHSKRVEKLVRDEDSKNDEEKVPEFAIRTQILLKKAEEKEKEKAKDKERKDKVKSEVEEEEEGEKEEEDVEHPGIRAEA
ncbi:harmonin-like [Actinia tenebrosa]|uniref:Harmonin-like n=1 Tax=Actinia tenebrosa TaxID=6105 RepID=A0A6P8IEH2_ACTTE|nr:harmonin-like [Actinia tenebrosa]